MYRYLSISGVGGCTRFTVYFLFIVHKNENCKNMTYTKIKFYIILIKQLFS